MGAARMFPRLIPVVLTFLMLGAHFLRSGNIALASVSALAPLLLLIRKRWTLLLVKWSAYLAALLWAHTTFVLLQQRMAAGAPWFRMFLILAGVTVFTLWAGYLLSTDTFRRRYS